MRGPRWHALALLVSGCLSTPPGSLRPDGDGGAIDAGLCPIADWADAGRSGPPDEFGNVLSLDFEDADTAYTFRDRSGWRRDAARLVGRTRTGVHGNALESADDSYALVAADGFDLGRELTIAAWVYLDEARSSAVFSDFDGDVDRYDLHIDVGGELVFRADGASGPKTVSTTPLITAGTTWFHVAATWSGDKVTLYVNGSDEGSSSGFVAPPIAHDVPFAIGRRMDGASRLFGAIDELRVWNRALSQVEIGEFMGEGDLEQRCGNGLIEEGEECERANPCCLDCNPISDGCGAAGCGGDGVCVTDCAAPTRGLVALYRFDEGEGTTVHDASGTPDPLDLELADSGDFTWSADGLELVDAVAVSTAEAGKVVDRILASDEFTIDVWLTPGQQLADELVRLVSLEAEGRGVVLGIYDTSFVARFAVAGTEEGTGNPGLEAFDRVRQGHKTHLVLTRSADGVRRIYLDGVLRDESRTSGVLGWGASQLRIGDAPSGALNFVGTLHRVAIHSVALDAVEVAASFHAGPRP